MSDSGIKKNMAYALGAESLQLLQSVLMSLIIPKILGVEQFGFWQLFIFYTSYGGFFHLGLLDGIYLKIGGTQREYLNFHLLASQLKALSIWLFLILSPIAIWGLYNDDPNRRLVIAASCLYILFNNILTYHSYLLQCINDIKAYSIGRFIDMASFVAGLVILLIGRIDFFLPYICVYFTARIISLIFYGFRLKELWINFFSRFPTQTIPEVFENIKVGVNLLASNIASMLVLGIGRWMVDKEWGIESFSKVSFSLIFVNFFLMFIQQASMVLFPDLRRRSSDQVLSIYNRMTVAVQCMIPLALLCYLPFVFIIKYWLPVYSESITYLIYLLPLCCFETKMQLIYNTMFKVRRMERKLLVCNILSLTASFIFMFIAIYFIQTLTTVVMAMFLAILVRSIIAELMIEKSINNNVGAIWRDLLPEILVVLIFIISILTLDLWYGWAAYLLFVVLYIFINNKTYKSLILKQK